MPTPLPDPLSLLSALNTLDRALSTFESGRADQAIERRSADDAVKVVVNGLGRVVSVTLAASELRLSAAVLAEKVRGVINEAIAGAYSVTAAAIADLASGLSLPGLPAYGAPPPGFADFVLTADAVEQQILANNPCQSPKLFECTRGPVRAVVNARREVVSLSITAPLPTSALYLGAQLVLAVNCGIDTGTERPDEDPTTIITTSRGLQDLVLYAKGTLKLNDRVKVRSLSCAGWGAVGNAGTVETNLGVEAKLGSVLSRARVVLRDRGEIHGFVRTADSLDRHADTVIEGTIEEDAVVVLPDLTLDVPFPTVLQGTIELEPNQQQTASPGYYNKLHPKSNAQVFLSSGTYYVNEVLLEPQSKVWLDARNGPVVIWVKNAFTHRGELLDAQNGFPRLFVGYLGTSVAVVENKYRGTLAAPSAKISISTIQSHEGAFHGKDVEVQPDTQICHRPFELRYEELPGVTPPGGLPPANVDLGFETTSGWSSPHALLTSVQNPVTQGARSLQISNVVGATDVVSAGFSAALAPQGATRLIVDLWVPSTQPNPTFFGNLGVLISIPSANIQALSLGTLGLSGRPTNQFSQFEFSLPANVRQALDGNATDVSLKLVFSINGGSGPWYIDNVRFLPPPASLASLDPILSFEDASKWSSAQVSLATATDLKTHLQRSLRVTSAPGWIQLVSVPFSTGPLQSATGKFRIDVRKPSTQPNQSWHGQFQLQLDVPSAGISNYTSAAVELTPRPSNTFSTLELTLPSNIVRVINAEYGDLKLKLVLNVTSGSGPWHLDNIRFV